MSDLNWNKLPWRKSSFSSDSANCVEVAWRTSSFCHQGSCVEVGWTSSSLCAGGDCVEVKSDKAQILVRDSKLGDDSPVLRFAVESWWVLTDAIVTAKDEDKDGRVWMHVRHRSVAYEPDGHVVLSTSVRSPRLRFTEDEWKAFVFGVQVKEFDPDRLSSPVSSSGTEDTGTVESLPVWGLDPEAATGAGDGLRGGVPVPVAAESSPPDDWFARQLDADCASIDSPAGRLAGRGSLLPASTPDDPRSGGQPGPYVAEITWSEDPSLGEPQGPPVGRPVDASTDEVTLSSAVQPGSDTAGTGTSPDPVPVAPEYGDLVMRRVEPRFIVDQAPERTLMSLGLLQSADERALFVAGGDTIYFGYDHESMGQFVYQVVGWDAERRGLILERISPASEAIDAELAKAAAPLVPAVETQETVS